MDSGKGSSDGNTGPEMGSGASANCAVRRKDIRTQPSRSSSRLWNKYYLPLQVFNNDLLRDKILEYAVLSGEYEEKRKTACSLRLVGRNWNETIIKVLYKNDQPLFRLEDGENMERFCATFASSTLINGRIPPFHFITPSLLTPKLATELGNLLTSCGEGLVQLRFWMAGNQFGTKFPKWPLIRLRKLEILFLLNRVSINNADGNGQDDVDKVNVHLLKSILKDATIITDLTISVASLDNPVNSAITGPSIYESIEFPTSVTKIILLGDLRIKDLETFASKLIPNLTILALEISDSLSLVDGLIYRILDNFRASLKTFLIDANCHRRQGQIAALIRFPVMEKLEKVLIDSLNVHLESGLHSLEKCLPKICTLHFHNLTQDTLRKWTDSSKFISVTTLRCYFARPRHLDYTNGLNIEIMQGVNFAFPNVRILVMGFSGRDSSGLEYIFKEMTRLTDLSLHWDNEMPEVNSDLWDTVLTGVSLETVAESREDPEFLERFDMNENGAPGSNIKNLKELTSLTLCGYAQSDNLRPLISDITFQRALLKMPKLKKLYLRGGFVASAQMTQEWRSEGRLLEYTE